MVKEEVRKLGRQILAREADLIKIFITTQYFFF